jgi:predicted DNA-binding protein
MSDKITLSIRLRPEDYQCLHFLSKDIRRTSIAEQATRFIQDGIARDTDPQCIEAAIQERLAAQLAAAEDIRSWYMSKPKSDM